MEKKPPKSQSKKPKKFTPLKFIIIYILFMCLFLFLIGLDSVKRIIDINGIYTKMIVYLTVLVLTPFHVIQSYNGSIIHLKGISLDVKFGCNGLEAFLIYTVAILSFPAKKIKKIVGILLGFVIIQFLNIIRIALLGLSGIYLKDYFQYFHIYIAQGIMIAVVLLLFFIWLQYATKE